MSSTLISLLKAEEAKKEKSKVTKNEVVQTQREYIQEPGESGISGQPVNQKVVNQLTSLVNQSEEVLVNQSEEVLVNQNANEKLNNVI
jgi:Cdc6-like AAA superfamily ATPase